MNEASKLIVAAALVALGLGLAYLCGPPADAPEVVRQFSKSHEALLLGPPGAIASTAPLRLHADAPSSAEMSAGGTARQLDHNRRSNSGGVILSAAESEADDSATSPAEVPRWFSLAAADNDWNSQPPRPVEVDDQAVPLSAIAPHAAGNSGTDDEWLLAPPTMPRHYDAKSAKAKPSPSLASDNSARRGDAATDAWWTRDTPRLQGLSGTQPTETRQPAPRVGEPTGTGIKSIPPADPNTRLAGPVDLDATSAASAPVAKQINAAPSASTPAAPPVVQPPTVAARTHLIADGDTLARLAERYLQDPGRAREIFELNRELLRDPNLLPIGAPLRIPGDPAQTEPELGETTATGRMVPIAAAPRNDESPTRARLQSPEPIAASGW